MLVGMLEVKFIWLRLNRLMTAWPLNLFKISKQDMLTSMKPNTVEHVRTLNLVHPKAQQVRSFLLKTTFDNKGGTSPFHLFMQVLWAINTNLKYRRAGLFFKKSKCLIFEVRKFITCSSASKEFCLHSA